MTLIDMLRLQPAEQLRRLRKRLANRERLPGSAALRSAPQRRIPTSQ